MTDHEQPLPLRPAVKVMIDLNQIGYPESPTS